VRTRAFLDALTQCERAALELGATRLHFEGGQALFHAGDSCGRVIALLTGRVKVCCATASGREVVLEFAGPGELLGELGALDGRANSAGAIALESVVCLGMGPETFRRFVSDHPRAGRLVLARLAERLREAERRQIEHVSLAVLGRVSARLVELVERFGRQSAQGIVIDLPLPQRDLAAWTGSSLESVARALQALRGLGAISTSRMTLIVTDPDALDRCAAQQVPLPALVA
jgi:CRP/FNR family cyclic AMP-dependent transcriptional regulator